ncbi:MAG TPA: ABC transporter permease [Ilumatobacteraceae bacterium]|jgi:molybdate transport system permease protein|nr:ABC transporter permease [Ilumatobacteraceae bacterium]
MTTRARRAERSLPWPALALAMIAIAFFALPLIGLMSRAPWSDAGSILRRPAVRQALRLSIVCSLCATALSVLLGLPLAWLLARRRFFGRSVVRALCTLSMVLPPVVGGVALLYALGRRGLVGQWLDRWFDVRLPFTSTGVVIAQTFVAMPFFIVTVEAAIRQADPGHDDAARTLGASSWYSFRRVTLPAVRSALVAGAVLSWARAFGEFGATITFAGSFPGKTQTLPLSVYLALDTDQPQAIVLALLMVAVSFGVLVALRDRWLGGGELTT